MTKIIAKTYNLADENRQRITYALLIACAAMFVFYGMNLYATVSRTVALEKLSAQTKTVEDSVRTLDTQYIALSSKITPEAAKEFGLKEVAVSAFIDRTTTLGLTTLQGRP